MVQTFQLCTGIQLSTTAVEQIFLPAKMGGLGLGRSLRLSHAAYLTSVRNFCTFGAELLKLPNALWQERLGDFQQVVDDFAYLSPPSTSQALSWLTANQFSQAHHDDFCSFRWWSQQIRKRDYDLLFDEATGRDRARLRCITDTSAGSWLVPCPVENLGLQLTPSEFTILLKWWLGISLLPLDDLDDPNVGCPSCGEAIDVYGDHFLCCRKGGMIQRHSAVVEHLWNICANLEVSLTGRTRPADILLTHWKGAGPCAIDVAVVHPLAPSNNVANVKTGMEAVQDMERVKIQKYSRECAESNVTFVPFVLSTFGMLGSDAGQFFHHLTSAFRLSGSSDIEGSDVAFLYMSQLQITLKRQIARMLLQGTSGLGPTDFDDGALLCEDDLTHGLERENEALVASSALIEHQ